MSDVRTAWLDWHRAHAEALAALQEAQRAYHRAIAGSAFARPIEAPLPVEIRKESLAALETARRHLDEVRMRQPPEPGDAHRGAS